MSSFSLVRLKVVVCVLVVFLGLSTPASSQDKATTLFLIVRTDPKLSKDDLEKTLQLGLDGTKSGYKAPIIAKPIPAGVFHEMEKMVGKGRAMDPRIAEGKEITFSQIPTPDGVLLRATLPKKTMQLREMKVNFKKAGEVKYTLKSLSPGEQFSLVTPGIYTMPMPKEDDEPYSYQAKILDKGVDQPDAKGDMDLGPRYYTVRINEFVGSQKQVFDFVSNPKNLANPLICEELRDYSFVFANLDTSDSRQKPAIDDQNIYYPRISQLRGANPRRAWILFPLTASQAETELINYRKYDFLQLPKEIRKNSEVITLGKVAELSTTSSAKWFELTSDGQTFTRGIKLNDLPKMQEKFPAWHRLVVYEFDDGSNPEQAIRVREERTGISTYVIDENVRELPQAIQIRLGGK
ncbi:MAG: hypothetical protein EXR99_16965 [Gemmataceae bacterium]|nr:hypothetical protein [Gemmataceae bacterium]